LGIATDITERHHVLEGMEARIRERTQALERTNQSLLREIAARARMEQDMQLFRDLIDRSNDEFTVIDGETGQIVDANQKACDNLGFPYGELVKKKIWETRAMFPADFTWEKEVEGLKAKGAKIVELRHKQADGSLIPVEVSTKYVELGGKGYVVAVVRDLTRRTTPQAAKKETNFGWFSGQLR
jgi:PAS domain S-box-containing protein